MVKRRKMSKKRRRVVASTVGVILLISLTLFTVGLVFVINNKCEDTSDTLSNTADFCKHGNEAIQSGLIDLLANVRQTHNEVTPYAAFLSLNPDLVPSRQYLQPSTIKDETDKARILFDKLKSLTIDESKLTSRELKGAIEVEHFLSHNFGQPEDDYYNGLWLLGPNLMCSSSYMCSWFQYHIMYTASLSNPLQSKEDILKIRKALEYYNKTVHQYIENVRYGVKSGMVRSIEACLAGLDAIKTKYIKVAEFKAVGILQEKFVQSMLIPRYYNSLSNKTKEEWRETYGKSVNETIRGYLVDLIGKPLEKLLRFLEYENMLYCVPSNVSSGLNDLPLSHIYFNGTKTDQKTSPFLPTGERLNGRKTYEKLVAFYTTTNLTSDEIYNLGWKQINSIYSKILKLAVNVTGHPNRTRAIEDFKSLLTDRSQFYNKEPFPQNESFTEAKKNCFTVAKAKKFCPKRWEALQTWFDEEAKLLSKLDPKMCNLFHFSGSKRTTPNCPIQLVPSFMPLAALSYRSQSSSCLRPARILLPFLNDNYGPRYQGISINSHEGRPGHHTQSQGYLENFESSCSPDDIKWLNKLTRYSSFNEGWGMYAEHPLTSEYTDIYDNDPISRYGMLKGLIWRALRLVVDSGLHYKGMKRDDAIDLFNKYTWDTSDIVSKEITRYQSVPGQALSYMIGQLTFIDLLNYTQTELGENFNIRDFHYQVLRHGSVPLHYIKYEIKKYVACKKDNADCQNLQASGKTSGDMNVQSNQDFNFQEIVNSDMYY